MTSRNVRRPRKPYDPTASLAATPTGELLPLEVELLPDNPDATEEMVVGRFAAGLAGERAEVLPRPSDFPDARVRLGQTVVGLELVEVVDADLRRRNVKRRWYGEAVTSAVSAALGALNGIAISVDDSAETDLWPPRTSTEALAVVADVANVLLESAGELASLTPGDAGRIEAPRGALPSASELLLRATCQRHNTDARITVRFSESSNQSADHRASLLAEAVVGKIAARYSTDVELWLVAWTTGGETDDSLARWRAWELLEHQTHPFAKVWTLALHVRGAAPPSELWPSRPVGERPPDPAPNTRVVSLDLQDAIARQRRTPGTS